MGRKHYIPDEQLTGWTTPVGTQDDFNGCTPNPYPSQVCAFGYIGIGVENIDIDFARSELISEELTFGTNSLVIEFPRNLTPYAYWVYYPTANVIYNSPNAFNSYLVWVPTVNYVQHTGAWHYNSTLVYKPSATYYQKATLTTSGILSYFPSALVAAVNNYHSNDILCMMPTGSVASKNNYVRNGIVELAPRLSVASKNNYSFSGILELTPTSSAYQQTTLTLNGRMVYDPTTSVAAVNNYNPTSRIVFDPNWATNIAIHKSCCTYPVALTLAVTNVNADIPAINLPGSEWANNSTFGIWESDISGLFLECVADTNNWVLVVPDGLTAVTLEQQCEPFQLCIQVSDGMGNICDFLITNPPPRELGTTFGTLV